MSHDQLKFWITCPNCKTAFGVEPRYILQYLNRVIDAKMGEKPETAGENRTEPTPTRPESEPTSPPARPPYWKYPKSGAGKPWQKR